MSEIEQKPVSKLPDYLILPYEILSDERLTLRHIRVLMAIFSWRKKSTGLARVSRTLLAERTNYPLTRISKITSELVKLGWIQKVGNGGKSQWSEYIIKDVSEYFFSPKNTNQDDSSNGYQNGNGNQFGNGNQNGNCLDGSNGYQNGNQTVTDSVTQTVTKTVTPIDTVVNNSSKNSNEGGRVRERTCTHTHASAREGISPEKIISIRNQFLSRFKNAYGDEPILDDGFDSSIEKILAGCEKHGANAVHVIDVFFLEDNPFYRRQVHDHRLLVKDLMKLIFKAKGACKGV